MEEINKELLINGDIYNFDEAESINGISFEEDFLQDGFKDFIEKTYIKDFIEFRKAYIKKDMVITRSLAHKFKGKFRILFSKTVGDNCEKLQFLIDKGHILQTNDTYITVVQNMINFLNCIIELSHKISVKIDEELITKFWDLNSTCNDFESIDNKKILTNENLEFDDLMIKKDNQVCCAGGNCFIY